MGSRPACSIRDSSSPSRGGLVRLAAEGIVRAPLGGLVQPGLADPGQIVLDWVLLVSLEESLPLA